MKKLLLFSLLAVFILSSCSSLQVMSDYDKNVDFTRYKTYSYYGWMKNSDKILNQLDKQRFEKAFANEFEKRGLTYVEKNGDIIVSLFIVTEEKQTVTANTTGGPYYGGYYYRYGPGWGWGAGMSTTTVSTNDYTVGTLICDVFDAKEKKLIWEGIAKGIVNENPGNRHVTIPKVVAKLMTEYPIPPVDRQTKK